MSSTPARVLVAHSFHQGCHSGLIFGDIDESCFSPFCSFQTLALLTLAEDSIQQESKDNPFEFQEQGL